MIYPCAGKFPSMTATQSDKSLQIKGNAGDTAEPAPKDERGGVSYISRNFHALQIVMETTTTSGWGCTACVRGRCGPELEV